MIAPPKFILVLCVLLSGFCLLTAPAGIYVAGTSGLGYVVAFEFVVLLAAAMGVLTGLGKLKSGPAMSMLCTGGVVFAGAVLSEPRLVARVLQGGSGGAATGGVDLTPWVIARVICGLGLCGLAALTLLLRRPGVSFPLLVRGTLLGLPVLAVLAALLIDRTRAMLADLSPIPSALLAVFGCLLMVALVSVSAHCIIRAFEVGIQAGRDPDAPTNPA